MKGSATGAQASADGRAADGPGADALREGRATGMRAAQAMLDSYAALVSGVLIGMSEGLQSGRMRRPKRPAKAKRR